MSYETPLKTTISLILFSLLTMTLLISTIVFSSEIGTANAQGYSVIATIPVGVVIKSNFILDMSAHNNPATNK